MPRKRTKAPEPRSVAPFKLVTAPPKSESYTKYTPAIQAAFDNPSQWVMIDTQFRSRGGAENVRRQNRERTDAHGRVLEFRITTVLNDPGQTEPYHQLFIRAVDPVAARPGSVRGAGEHLHTVVHDESGITDQARSFTEGPDEA